MNNSLPYEQYEQLLAHKIEILNDLLCPFSPPALHIYRSPKIHYRMRAEFRIWHDDQNITHCMFDPVTKKRVVVTDFPVASKLINRLMPVLLDVLKNNTLLREKLFQIDYLSTLSEKLLVTLIYHKKLDDNWLQQAKTLRYTLQNTGFDIQLIGRASRQKICLEQDYIDEVLPVGGKYIIYRQIENSFTQPNAAVNIHMLEWAIGVTKNSKGDLLELYCGNGNFSLALAKNFRYILATEIAKPSVAAAQYNIAINHIDNVKILRLSAEEFVDAQAGVRTFNRLQQQQVCLADYDCQTILVDPPRSGLSTQSIAMVKQYRSIIYISCNPETLTENLHQLTDTHSITELAVFDQFPYTPHLECGVVLVQK